MCFRHDGNMQRGSRHRAAQVFEQSRNRCSTHSRTTVPEIISAGTSSNDNSSPMGSTSGPNAAGPA